MLEGSLDLKKGFQSLTAKTKIYLTQQLLNGQVGGFGALKIGHSKIYNGKSG